MSIYNPYIRPDFRAICENLEKLVALGEDSPNRDGTPGRGGVSKEAEESGKALVGEYNKLIEGTNGVPWHGWEGMLRRWRRREQEESTEIFRSYVESIGDESRWIRFQENLDGFIDECGRALVKKHGGKWDGRRKTWRWANEPEFKRGVSLRTYRQYTIKVDELRNNGAGWCTGESRSVAATLDAVIECVREMMGRPY